MYSPASGVSYVNATRATLTGFSAPLLPKPQGDIEKLWATAQRQNAEAAAVKRLDLLLDAQRRQVAHHAGEQWKPLFDYLSGQLGHLPEG